VNRHIYQPPQRKEMRTADTFGFLDKLTFGNLDFRDFKENGLKSTKTLIKYDVWDCVKD